MDLSDVGQENMAEAAVENPAARFFCHRCTQEVNPVLPDYICPRCQSGFIEELALAPSDAGDESDDELDPLSQVAGLWNMLNIIRRPDDAIFANAIATDSREPRNAPRAGPSRRPRLVRAVGRRSGQDADMARNRTEGFLQQLVTTLSANHPGFIGSTTGFPVFFNLHSNPGDYAWGRGSWNAIITQLINQLDGTGPPPLPKEKIDEIPIVDITQDQVDKNLQCTVCMEDFKKGEPVRQLPCDHHFHNDCIIPWLELHGTCPICRKLLNEVMESEGFLSSSSGGNPDIITIPGPSAGQQSASQNSATTGTRGSGYNPHQPSVYDFTDDFD